MRPGNNKEDLHGIDELNEDDDPGFLNEHFGIQEEPEADRAAPARSRSGRRSNQNVTKMWTFSYEIICSVSTLLEKEIYV